MSEIGAEISDSSVLQNLKEPITPIVTQTSAVPEKERPKDVIYQFYHDYLAPFIVTLSIRTLDKLKADPSLKAVVFRRDGVQIDTALQKLRQFPEYSKIPTERIQRLDFTKPILQVSVRDGEQKSLVEKYLDQAGLRDGSPILFIDTGFNNTIPRRLKEDFLPENIQTDSIFLVSMNQQAEGVVYDYQSAYAHPGDQAVKPEAGVLVSILESLGKGVRKKITRLVQDADGKIHGEFSHEEDKNYRRENLTALRAIVDYIDEQPRESFLEKHKSVKNIDDIRQKMEQRLGKLTALEKVSLKIDK